MNTILRPLAGGLLIAASLGLSAVSGSVSYDGFSSLIGIAFAGWLGPLVAVSIVGLGVAVSADLADRRFVAAGVLAICLAGACGLDWYSNRIAFLNTVAEAAQAGADRDQAFSTATEALSLTRAEIAELESHRQLMLASDPAEVEAAQLLLSAMDAYSGAIDGQRGPLTLAAMRDYGGEVRQRLATLREQETAHTATVGAGVTVTEAAFRKGEAELYAALLTILSTALSFIGGFVIGGKKAAELDEAYRGAEALENEVARTLADVIEFNTELRA